jgi:hypothetical protein
MQGRGNGAYKHRGWSRPAQDRKGGAGPPSVFACSVRFAHKKIEGKVYGPSLVADKVLLGRG